MGKLKKIDTGYPSGSMRKHVYQEIESAILSGALGPGESLGEVKLSEELGVSRTPVREALVQLELEGLVKTIPNRGAVVVGVTEDDVKEIYQIRMRIEGLAARRTAERITEDEIEQMREILELQEFYVSRGDTMQVWHLDSRFHDLLFECCRSRPLKHMLSSFHNYIQNARASTVREGRAEKSTSEHRKIFEAIERRDPDMAEKYMSEHVTNARDSFFEYMGFTR